MNYYPQDKDSNLVWLYVAIATLLVILNTLAR
jgi:hypothetical protein